MEFSNQFLYEHIIIKLFFTNTIFTILPTLSLLIYFYLMSTCLVLLMIVVRISLASEKTTGKIPVSIIFLRKFWAVFYCFLFFTWWLTSSSSTHNSTSNNTLQLSLYILLTNFIINISSKLSFFLSISIDWNTQLI